MYKNDLFSSPTILVFQTRASPFEHDWLTNKCIGMVLPFLEINILIWPECSRSIGPCSCLPHSLSQVILCARRTINLEKRLVWGLVDLSFLTKICTLESIRRAPDFEHVTKHCCLILELPSCFTSTLIVALWKIEIIFSFNMRGMFCVQNETHFHEQSM